MTNNTPAVVEPENAGGLVVVDAAPVSLDAMIAQVQAIQNAMGRVMIEGTHYGKIPECGDKDTLLKPGAEKIGLLFRLLARFQVERQDSPGGHREYVITCSLHDINNNLIGQGLGSCSTMESKYRWRKGERLCPMCNKPTIIKGKAAYGGGWVCWGKKGGCGEKFLDGDEQIEGQQADRIENADIADVYNTVLKIGKKRAHVDAILTCTAASDIFTQDIEDMPIDVVSKDAPQVEKPAAEELKARNKRAPAKKKMDAEKTREAFDSAALLLAFSELGVSEETLVDRIGCSIKAAGKEEHKNLRDLYKLMKSNATQNRSGSKKPVVPIDEEPWENPA